MADETEHPILWEPKDGGAASQMAALMKLAETRAGKPIGTDSRGRVRAFAAWLLT